MPPSARRSSIRCGARLVARDAPVEAVAAEIAQPAALPRIGGQRIERAERVVFRMRSGQHRAIRRDQRDAFVVQVLVGDDIEVEALLLQPGQQMQVRRIVPHAGAARIVERQKPGRIVRIGRWRDENEMPLPSTCLL